MVKRLKSFFSFVFFVLQRAFLYFLCTVSGCDGGNRTRNIAVYTWRFRDWKVCKENELVQGNVKDNKEETKESEKTAEEIGWKLVKW